MITLTPNGREILIKILSKRINDRKFLNLMKQRLDYQYLDETTNKYIEKNIGIPQGGIDSPYLWNIYMSEFDNHIQDYMNNLINNLNNKIRKNLNNPRTKIITKDLSRNINKRRTLLKRLSLLQKVKTQEKYNELKRSQAISKNVGQYFNNEKILIQSNTRKILDPNIRFNIIKEIKLQKHKQRNM